MKITTRLSVLFVAALVISGAAQAGNLEPAGPPAPTMVTLQQIYDELGILSGVARLPVTGQTGSWDSAGSPVACGGTGQDGELQRGVSLSPRFLDNGDGTISDDLTGLVWLQDANCFGASTWSDALASANTLADGSCSLTDGSAAGDWRLPNIRELQSLIDYNELEPAMTPGHPFVNVQSAWPEANSTYWSSSITPIMGVIPKTSALDGEGDRGNGRCTHRHPAQQQRVEKPDVF